jgi:cell cycle checkpoint protein
MVSTPQCTTADRASVLCFRFNAVAPTILTKALTRTVARAYAPGGSYPDATPPNAETLKLIAAHSNGDLRSALMSLEFLASEPGGAAAVTSLAPAPSKKRKANGSAATGSRKEQVQKL